MKKTKLLVMLVFVISCILASISFADVILPRPEEYAKVQFAKTKNGTVDVDEEIINFTWTKSFEATANQGYRASEVFVDGNLYKGAIKQTKNNKADITLVAEEINNLSNNEVHTIEVKFKSEKTQKSELVVDCGTNGYYMLNNEPKNNGKTSYTFEDDEREDVDVIIWADSGYHGIVTIQGQTPDERNTILLDHELYDSEWNDHMVFKTLSKDTTITVTFEKDVVEVETPTTATHRISVACNTSGDICPEGSGDIDDGQSITIEFTAREGNKLGEILLDGNRVSATKLTKDDGTEGFYTLSNIKADHEIVFVFEALTSEVTPVPTPVVEPTEKPEATYVASEWALPEMEKADQANLIPSELRSSDLTKNVTRTEFAKVCVSLYDAKASEELKEKNQDLDETNPFVDVDDADVTRAFRLGITQGVGDNKFDPDANITREQMATMLYRLAGTLEIKLDQTEENDFTDAGEVSDWAKDSVTAMSGAGIIKGMGDGLFAPKGTATREQAIAIANRLNNK